MKDVLHFKRRVKQYGSGQVRSECLTCTFRASCCSARLSRAQAHWKTVNGQCSSGGRIM